MSRKDYKLIADAIKEVKLASYDDEQSVIAFVARKIADKLQDDNPRFDRAKFLKACGLD